jgi:hypothetical protein
VTLLLNAVIVLFFLKIGWNLIMPYALAYRSLKADGQARGVSLLPVLEVILWLVALGLSIGVDSNNPIHSTKMIGVGGLVVIVGCLVHFVVAGAVSGWVVSRLKR